MSFLAKFNNDGSLNETSGSNIFQYSSGANVIEMQIDKPQNSVVTISLVRADAVELSAKPCVAKLGSTNAWVYTFDKTDLSVDGDLDIAFTISYNGVDLNTETITGTVQTSFNNGYTAVDPTMTEEILQWLANLQVDKVGRYDIEDLPVDITYTADGLKSANNLFFNAEFIVGGTLTAGTLLITATGTTIITQQETFFAGDEIYRRILTINGETITVGDWKNYTEAISTHNLSSVAHGDIRTLISNETTARQNADIVLQNNIDAITQSTVAEQHKLDIAKVYDMNFVSRHYYEIIVLDTVTLADLSNNVIHAKVTTDMQQTVDSAEYLRIKNVSGTTLIDYVRFDFDCLGGASATPELITKNSLFSFIYNSSTNAFEEKQRYFYRLAQYTHNGTVTPTERINAQNAVLKTAQTLSNEEKSQVQTNIDVYSKLEVDNKVSSVYKYKGSVATYGDLPTSGLTIGDVYNVEDTGDNYAWNGTVWDKLAGTIDLSGYVPTSRTINGHALSSDVTVSKSDVGLGNVYNPTAYGGISYGGGAGEAGISFTDLNSLVYTGFYTCYGTTANVPSASYSWFVQHINSNVGNVSATQIAIAYGTTNIIYKRNKTSSTWGAWENISPSLKENLTNKVTSISSSSTDTQYPSAKCVYDIVGNIVSLMEVL